MKNVYVFLLSWLFINSTAAQLAAVKNLKPSKRIHLLSTKDFYTPVKYVSLDLNSYDKNDFNRIRSRVCNIVITAFEYAEETDLNYIKEDAVVSTSIYPVTETKLSLFKLSIADMDYLVGNSRLVRMGIVVKL